MTAGAAGAFSPNGAEAGAADGPMIPGTPMEPPIYGRVRPIVWTEDEHEEERQPIWTLVLRGIVVAWLAWVLVDFGRRDADWDARAQELLAADFEFNRRHQEVAFAHVRQRTLSDERRARELIDHGIAQIGRMTLPEREHVAAMPFARAVPIGRVTA